MRKRFPTLAILATLAFGFGVSGPVGNASAMSAPGAARAVVDVQPAGPVQMVDHRGRYHRDWDRYDRRDWRRYDRHDWRRHERRHYRPRSGFYLEFGTPGPRYAPRRSYGLSGSHVNWCHARYRSYRAWDNTFQPYHGPRRQCVSPYV